MDALNETTEMNNAIDEVAGTMNPQEKGWDAKTAVNYDNYTTDQEARAVLEESGALLAWAHEAARYEWSDEFGDVGPAVPALEAQLFSKDLISKPGSDFDAFMEFTVTQEGPVRVQPIRSFDDAGLHPIMLQNVKLCQYDNPTPIQAYSLPSVLTGNDLVAVAQTGSGKTAAYLVPIISRLMGKAKKLCAARPNTTAADYDPVRDAVRAEPLVLIIVPTRELAMQIFDDCRRFSYRSMLRPCVVYGGAPRRSQMDELKRGCDILIGTPGRLKDILENDPRWLSLNRVRATILDEADSLLEASWEDDLKIMLPGGVFPVSDDHQFLMFSATFKKNARQVAKQYLTDDYVRIRVGRAGSTHKNIKQTIVWVDEDQKKQALADLLLSMEPARTLIFCNTTHGVDQVDDFMYSADFPVTSIHSQRTQREREDALRAFRSAKCPILVATGVSSRGLDIRNVLHVINYDLPNTTHEDGGIVEYAHRIGRTARIGNQGLATSFYNDRNEDMAKDLVRLLVESKQEIPDFLQSFAEDDLGFEDDLTDDEGGEGGDDGVEVKAGAAGGWGAAEDEVEE